MPESVSTSSSNTAPPVTTTPTSTSTSPSSQPFKASFDWGPSSSGKTSTETTPDISTEGTQDIEPEIKLDLDKEDYTPNTEAEETEKHTDETKTSEDEKSGFNKELEAKLSEDPKLLKEVKALFYENRDFKKHFKSVKDMTKHMERINTLGGLDAVEQEAKAWATTWTAFQAGDPAVLDSWFSENPEGANKLFVPILNRYYKSHQDAYNHQMSTIFKKTLEMPTANGVSPIDALTYLYQQIGDNPDALALLQPVTDVIETIWKNAGTEPDGTRTKAESLQQKEAQLKQQEHNFYKQSLDSQVVPLITRAGKQALAQLSKGYNLPAEVQKEILADINNSFAEIMKKDDDFQENASSLFNARESERFMKLLRATIEKKIPLAAKNVWRKYSSVSNLTQSKKEAVGKENSTKIESGSGSGSPTMTSLPKGWLNPSNYDQIDYKRMKAAGLDVLDGILYLKNKKGRFKVG